MPRRDRPPETHGKHHKRRAGTHKRSSSPETVRWNTSHLIPERPSWMEADTYTKLADLRRSL